MSFIMKETPQNKPSQLPFQLLGKMSHTRGVFSRLSISLKGKASADISNKVHDLWVKKDPAVKVHLQRFCLDTEECRWVFSHQYQHQKYLFSGEGHWKDLWCSKNHVCFVQTVWDCNTEKQRTNDKKWPLNCIKCCLRSTSYNFPAVFLTHLRSLRWP